MDNPLHELINILVVDDNIENVTLLKEALDRDGVNITAKTSPKNVVQHCIEKDVSIALIDVKMPEIDGFELLSLIKSNPLTEHIMVILITGFSMSSEEVIKGLNGGAVDFLFKPLDIYITIAKVDSLIKLVSHQREIETKNRLLESYQIELYKAIKVIEDKKVIKENFLANMSHEIRTPLNAIQGLTHLLKESTVDAEREEIIKLMEYSSNSLLGIVNDILEDAQIDAGKIKIEAKKINVISLVNSVCDLTTPMALAKGLTLDLSINEDIPPIIIADPLRLNQILMNLINNAIKFTKTGAISVSLDMIEKHNSSAVLAFKIKDTGIGISEASIDKIFNRFEQVEDKTWQNVGGTGLGLSIVKRLIELMGGEIKVESAEGVGTEFTFTNWFTVIDTSLNDTIEEFQLSSLPKFENMTILLAEDIPSNQFVMVEILKKWNIKVDTVLNGMEAYEKLKSNDYNLILMDTHMPVMNGNETIKKIRNEMDDDKKDIPIVCYSASVIEYERAEARNCGANDFIEKPIEPQLLHQKISKLVKKTNATISTGI
jgi:signal transduction histidine kinase